MTATSYHKSILLFAFLLTANLLAIGLNLPLLQMISKPLLVPVLMYWLYNQGYQKSGKLLLLSGLLFSWLGDIFLLFENRIAWFFIAGLICFLTTHILYIVFFLKIRSEQSSLLLQKPLYLILIIAYGISLVSFLYPVLGELTIPVMVYAAVICTMLLCSVHVYNKLQKGANKLFVTGAILFVFSDSILAINKFWHPLPAGGILIMFTYGAAQFLIVKGFLKIKNG